MVLATVAALVVLSAGVVVPSVFPTISVDEALAAAGPLAGVGVGVGLGHDTALSEAAARGVFAVGSALLIFGFVGLAVSSRVVIIAVAPLSFALKGVSFGHRITEQQGD